jgi:hypothetical protein
MRETVFSSLWLIDLQDPATAVQLAEHVVISSWDWLQDEKGLIYSADFSVVMEVDASTLEKVPLRSFEQELGEYFLFDLVGQTSTGGYVILERREENHQLDSTFEKLIYIDLGSGDVLPVIEGTPISSAILLPASDEVWLTSDETRQGWIVELPGGLPVAGPSALLYPPARDELDSRPDWDSPESAAAALQPRFRSLDMQLITGYRGDALFIWDVLTGEFTSVGSSLEGRMLFLGWVPDPLVYPVVAP